jgi:hypothetical protein
VTYLQLRHASQDVFGVGRIGILNIGRQHGDFQAVLADDGDKTGKIVRYARGFHVTVLANGEINTVEAHLCGGFSEGSALQKQQMLGKDGDLQSCG